MPPRPTVGRALRRVAVVSLLLATCLTPLTAHADAEVIRLSNEADRLYQMGDYSHALASSKAALGRATDVLGARDPTTLTALSNYAFMLDNLGRAAEAEPLYKRALDLFTEIYGQRHPNTIISLSNYAGVLKSMGQTAKAEPLMKRAVDISTEVLGEKHPTTLRNMSNYAGMLNALGHAAKAEPIYKKVLDTRTETLGKRHTDTLYSLNNYAFVLKSLAKNADSAKIYKRALDGFTEKYGEKHPDTLTALNNYADILQSLGHAAEAEPLFRRSLDLRTEVLGENHPSTLTSLNNYADVLKNIGRIAEAEPLYKRVLDLRIKILGEKHPNTLSSLNNYAGVLESLGRTAKAEPLYKRALELRTETLGERHPDTLANLNNYAGALERAGRAAEAAPLYRRALNLRVEIFGEKHPDTLNSLNNYAYVLHALGFAQESEKLFRKVYILRTEILGEKHPDTIRSLNNYAVAMNSLGDSAEAASILKRAFEINVKIQGEMHPQTLMTALNHASTLLQLNRTNEALDGLEWGVARIHDWSGGEMRAMTRDAGRRELVARSSNWIDAILTVAMQRASPRATELAAQTILRWKHRAGESDALIARLMRNSKDSAIRAKAVEAGQLRREVAALARHDQEGKFNAAAERLDALMRDLRQSQRDPALFTAAQISTPTLVAGRLPHAAALVEFRLYEPFDFNTRIYAPRRLAALLIEPGKQPLVYDAGDEEALTQLIGPARRGDRAAAAKLFSLAFGPAAESLKDAAVIFIAPDGPLWDLSPAVLRATENSDFWLKDKPLRIIATGRELLSAPSSNAAVGVVAIGGVDFGAQKPAGAQQSTRLVDSSPAALMRKGREALSPLSPLKHSEREVSFLQNLYEGAVDPVTALYGAAATETALKRLPKPPKVLHLATHGDYRALEKIPDRPEVMSWVALAGANRGLQGKVDADGEDGLLTALEAAALPLEGTELVALSACLTGAGHKDYSEGLIGLTRAFRIAGARRVLAALRTVPDDLAADFMIAFHRQWLADGMKDAHESLRRVQLAYADDPDPKKRDPAFWGAFVMIGP